MKKLFFGIFVCLLCISCIDNQKFKDGDIIFHTSKSSQSKVIQEITKSKYSHVGIIITVNNELYVLEAVQPAKLTKLDLFINRGLDSKYTVMRYNTSISVDQIKKMKSFGKSLIGKPYDLQFKWDNDKIYCSELVWKIYNAGNIRLCEPKQFNDYDLTSKSVIKMIETRYKTNFNYNEMVVSPAQLAKSNQLHIIYDNY